MCDDALAQSWPQLRIRCAVDVREGVMRVFGVRFAGRRRAPVSICETAMSKRAGVGSAAPKNNN
jgi:hypothetical protein